MNQPLELTVMMYHYIRDKGDDAEAGSGIAGMPIHVFERQLDDLSRQYRFVTWPQVQMALQGRKPLPISACLLTFDDGILDHYINVFKVLQERKLSGLFFALGRCEDDGLTLAHKIHFLLAKLGLPDFRNAFWEKLNLVQRQQFAQAEKYYQLKFPPISLDKRINLLKAVLQRDLSAEIDPLLSDLFETHVGSERETAQNYYLTTEQIREMAAGGMHFGGHSRSHPWFDWIDAEARTAEIRASADWLQQFEARPWAFAYPYGGFSEDSPNLLKQHGFIAAFTTQTQLRHSDPYFIGRLDGEEVAQDAQGYV
ncbi:MAG TPA: polysaccharide deacetylase family protein [Anaerolineales bacterium]|nr:polysaccharide deacetylase family protein [Anaerolineales bacterium]